MTPEQREELAETGLVRLPRLVPVGDVAALADLLWAKLASKYGIDRQRRETWTIERPAQLAGPVYDRVANREFRDVIDVLLGEGRWAPPPRWGLPLVCFPTPGPWNVPWMGWHLDAPASAETPPIVRAFTVLEPLDSGGGGTVCVTGSHRLAQRLAAERGRDLPSAKAKALLSRAPWFADLLSSEAAERRIRRFMEDGATVDGVALRVVEMTGEPGDVILMHPLMLHSFAPNVLDRPRLALTHWIYGKALDA